MTDKTFSIVRGSADCLLTLSDRSLNLISSLSDIEACLEICFKSLEGVDFDTRRSLSKLIASLLASTQVFGSAVTSSNIPTANNKAKKNKEGQEQDEEDPPRRVEGFPSSRRGTCTSSTGRASFQPARYMYLAEWKGNPPPGEVHASPAGRKPFQPARMCLAGWKNLAGWKETLPAGHWLRVSLGIPGYPPGLGGETAIRSRIRIPWRVSAGTSGYPPADNGYPQRIIRDHL
ncbi:hypothetical protein PGT21_023862 [Puccinia graminis f. sp. tritici]|uniref:Uncharacterized protein n=1 Tax=Puccinia graminis f. sp. tritici TaxID=56615 RepID=A0A5B0M4P5_PUCGR|nr:hypothetical protein PGT21_023862 [Puccinia graminis f. sp. tritici]KAA1125710.1 hypothetical protein PGTUg99_003782 [Puccinia graminis f. sp. tritici]